MLIVNGKQLDLVNPKTELEKQVVSEMQEITKKFSLDKGGTISVVYPEEYIRYNKENKKPDKPASFKISFRDFLKSETGSQEWRYCTGTQQMPNRVTKYFPSFFLFEGSWVLGKGDIDLIYYLMKVYSRLKGGGNSGTQKPYIKIENKADEAKAANENTRKRLFIENAILNSIEEGGLGDEGVRSLAKSLFIPGASTKPEIEVIRAECIKLIKTQRDGYDLVKKAYDESRSGESEFKELVQELIDNNVVGVIQKGPSKAMWLLDTDGQPVNKICQLQNKKTAPKDEIQFAAYLSENPDDVEILKTTLETYLETRKGKA